MRIAGPAAEARRLALRLSRAGIPALPDDGESRAELIVALADTDLPFLRARAGRLVAVGQPSMSSFQAGADDVVPAAEPQVLFRRVHALIEQADLEAREQRLAARLRALEESLAEVAHDLRSPLHAAIGHGDLLAKDPDLTAEQRKSAEAVVRQGGRALALAERILEGAGRPEDTELHVAAVRLNELVDAAVTGAAASDRVRPFAGASTTTRSVCLPFRCALAVPVWITSQLVFSARAISFAHLPSSETMSTRGRADGICSGSSTKKRLPAPGVLSAHSSPPWRSAMAREIRKPRPPPRPASSLCRSLAAIPEPVSRTQSRTTRGLKRSTLASTSPPEGVWRIAFPIRLSSSRASRSRSARSVIGDEEGSARSATPFASAAVTAPLTAVSRSSPNLTAAMCSSVSSGRPAPSRIRSASASARPP